MRIGEFETHEAADCFPMHDVARLYELTEDIRANGLIDPITLYGGEVLDGRNRLRACLDSNTEPSFVDFSGDPAAHVRSKNAMRRDLSDDARLVCLLRLNDLRGSGSRVADSATLAGVAEDTGSSYRKATQANRIVHEAPAIADAVIEHGVSIDLAEKMVKASKDDQKSFLAKIDAGVKPTHAARELNRERLAESSLDLPDGIYRVIYADPPWKYGDSKAFDDYSATAAEGHYPTMPLADICDLPVRDIAADNAVLFLWGTFPLMPDALEVIRAWGFKYKTAFVWDKQRTNMGNYHTADAELLLVATRGSCVPDAKERERQVQSVKRTERHSAKPEHFREMVERLYFRAFEGGSQSVELFRRGDALGGWEVWGNEISQAG